MIVKNTGHNKNHLILYINPDFVESKKDQNKCRNKHDRIEYFDYFIEKEYGSIRSLVRDDVPQENVLVADMMHQTVYKPLEFIEATVSNDILILSAEVNFRITEWQHEYSVSSFVERLRRNMSKLHSIHSVQDNLFDEDLIHIKFKLESSNGNDTISCLVNRLSALLAHEDCVSRKFISTKLKKASKPCLRPVTV